MPYIKRVSLNESYCTEMDIWTRGSSGATSVFELQKWPKALLWTTSKHVSSLVLPVADAQKLFDVRVGGIFEEVEAELMMFYNTSKVGQLMLEGHCWS